MSVETIRKISVRDLKPGMYVTDFNHDWQDPCCKDKDPNAFRGPRRLQTEAEVQAVITHGILEVYIDVAKGEEADGTSLRQVEQALSEQLMALDDDDELSFKASAPIPFEEELSGAAEVKSRARKIVGDVLADARLGKQVALGPVQDAVRNMAESMFRNPDAILSLSLIKKRDEYTFMHSVNVGVFLMSFCRALKMKEETIIKVGVGGMLHDIGKMKTPESILNKAGKLTDEEFLIMKQHVTFSRQILEQTPGIPEISVFVAAQHHERFDGTGYPHGLKGDNINEFGQMAAIVDVYDAITSDRVYHKGNPPHVALKRMMDWSKNHFNPRLFQKFVQCVGIYPMGTLVRLENNLIGVVIRSNAESLLHPCIKVIIDGKVGKKLKPMDLNLMDHAKDTTKGYRIIRSEPIDKWKVDPKQFMPQPELF
ncbi:MAG: metal dependent phosphohydrolase [Magnetococcales bacterium]|nr:metal dependent phosphohydrolase [Magnetococcales bacterium]HIJ82577.1 HD-GYP domain-containing protein [Magnetococcales bacterium]